MRNSLPESGFPGESTATIWDRRTRGTRSVAFAAALTGVESSLIRSHLSVSLAASDEAAELLDRMEFLFRTLTTTIASESERCILSVRGPVLWSETITARANALGNEDVFVCATSKRSFDTVENRVLVAALDAIAGATRALQDPDSIMLPGATLERAEQAARLAKKWRSGPRLAEVSGSSLSSRDTARLRGSRRMSRMAAVLAVIERQAEPFEAAEIIDMSDTWTRRYHDFVLWAIAEISGHVRLPSKLTCFEGGIWAGPVSFRHPSAMGGTPSGLAFRGIPLLPPSDLLDGAPWELKLPTSGIVASSRRDIERLMGRLSGAATSAGYQRS